jgi:hypothetical protein
VTIYPLQRGPLDWRCREHGVIEVVDGDEPYVPRLCPVLDDRGRPCLLPLYLAKPRSDAPEG